MLPETIEDISWDGLTEAVRDGNVDDEADLILNATEGDNFKQNSTTLLQLLRHFAVYTNQKQKHMTYLLTLLKLYEPIPCYSLFPSTGKQLLNQHRKNCLQLSRLVINLLDGPMRSHLKRTKGHSGYWSCDRCIQKGEMFNKAILLKNVNAPRRKDSHFLRITPVILLPMNT